MTPTPADALRALRAASHAHLALSEHEVRPVRYVFDRRRGRLLFPLPGDVGEPAEGQLLVPEEQDPVVAALLSIEPQQGPPGDAALRYEIYHGPARETLWAVARVEALRYRGEAFDAEEIELADALAPHEPALCRSLNADPALLRQLCERRARARVERPVAVGVDPDGIDIRARFGIVRIEFDEPAPTPEVVRERLASLAARSAP